MISAVDLELLYSVIDGAPSYDPVTVRQNGALGLMQLMLLRRYRALAFGILMIRHRTSKEETQYLVGILAYLQRKRLHNSQNRLTSEVC